MSYRLCHACAAANSNPAVVTWTKTSVAATATATAARDDDDGAVVAKQKEEEESLVYASNAMIYLARSYQRQRQQQPTRSILSFHEALAKNKNDGEEKQETNIVEPISLSSSSSSLLEEVVWSVHDTLRTTHMDAWNQASNTSNNHSSSETNPSTTTTTSLPTAMVITALCSVPIDHSTTITTTKMLVRRMIVTGFSNGTITLWYQTATVSTSTNVQSWKELMLWNETNTNHTTTTTTGTAFPESITAIEGFCFQQQQSNEKEKNNDNGNVPYQLCLLIGTSVGASWLVVNCTLQQEKSLLANTNNNNDNNSETCSNPPLLTIVDTNRSILWDHPAIRSVHIVKESNTNNDPSTPCLSTTTTTSSSSTITITNLWLLMGTASPRHNQILVYHCTVLVVAHSLDATPTSLSSPQYAGSLSGHEDWITSMDHFQNKNKNSTVTLTAATTMSSTSNSELSLSTQPQQSTSCFWLASASQDGRIRLWKFVTTTTTTTSTTTATATVTTNDSSTTETYYRTPNDDDINNNSTNETANDEADEEDISHQDEEEDKEGESRLEYTSNTTTKDATTTFRQTTLVFLESILMGHDQAVTSVCWHPQPQQIYGQDMLLISASMDRTILLWGPPSSTVTTTNPSLSPHPIGIWTPLGRVGGMGGILGGPIGSSLMGFLRVTVQPLAPRRYLQQEQQVQLYLLGHAFGGAIHVWRPLVLLDSTNNKNDNTSVMQLVEDRASRIRWKAMPSITGHFRAVTDLCWEATSGDYLVTVSKDQTCRVWIPITTTTTRTRTREPSMEMTNNDDEENTVCWVEIARPSVHGYDLSAVTSLSTPRYPHRLVVGADEKELRVLDAPLSFLQQLQQQQAPDGTTNASLLAEDCISRVQRALLPSLGLSNKPEGVVESDRSQLEEEDKETTTSLLLPSDEVTAVEEAAIAANNANASRNVATTTSVTYTSTNEFLSLPLERDLGAVTLWPETLKLFGHAAEIHCITSTLAARTCLDATTIANAKMEPTTQGSQWPDLVASSTRARDADTAAIRLWNVSQGKCVQVLSEGGHKSTVATMSFSPDGTWLASSGKDRRLCLWKRRGQQQEPNSQEVDADVQTTFNRKNDSMFSLVWAKDGAHKRIVWSVHFCPFDNRILASGSRDGTVRIWSIHDANEIENKYKRTREDNTNNKENSGKCHVQEIFQFSPSFGTVTTPNQRYKPDSVTALAFAPLPIYKDNDYNNGGSNVGSDNVIFALLALGLESGRLELWRIPLAKKLASGDKTEPPATTKQPVFVGGIPLYMCHVASVTKLAWRPQKRPDDSTERSTKFYLSSCSVDHACRINEITV